MPRERPQPRSRSELGPAVGGWLWLFPLVYGLHLFDEYSTSIGLAGWSLQHFGIQFTDTAWIAVNVPSLAVLTAAAALVARGRWPAWIAVALASHVAMHALAHLAASLWVGALSPGLLSGLVACLPLAIATFAWAHRALPRRQLLQGAIVGAATFQPLWHLILLPVLPALRGSG